MGILKAMPVIITIAFLLVGMTAMNASARVEARWALQTGDIIAGEDISIEHPCAELFHQQTATATDIEHLDINFPITADDLGLGPGTLGLDPGVEASATANVLPFGPVNLAFPDIHQDVAQTMETTSTGFFTANWAYFADTVSGNLGSEPLGTHLASGHPFKSSKMMGSEFIWPLMIPKASASTGGLSLDVDSLSPGIVPDVPSFNSDILKFDMNITRGSGPTPGMPNNSGEKKPVGWGLRKPRIDPRMTQDEIKSTTTMQRVYRNAFIASTMHNAYEGPTQYPTWIDPYDNGRGVFNQIDMQNILKIALKKTQPGERIAPVFWDL
ncbi:MAG TPA: hypothetical protein VMC84_09445 [Methanocella sp.]|uniref:hypothetical protein n=1 Tax=Methanocella sp. TaxID=2052833 RepID=UPI002B681FC1|nr:hypothetical protein [Methanocella sp.]HTY91388.1 hypothetical protein [Methanocella sp.]